MVVPTMVVLPIVAAIADWKAHSWFLDHVSRSTTLTQQIGGGGAAAVIEWFQNRIKQQINSD